MKTMLAIRTKQLVIRMAQIFRMAIELLDAFRACYPKYQPRHLHSPSPGLLNDIVD